MPTRLPRGTQQQCSQCQAWRILVDGSDQEVILTQAQLDRAIGMLQTEYEIEDLPEVEPDNDGRHWDTA
jgi:hypothetical protein